MGAHRFPARSPSPSDGSWAADFGPFEGRIWLNTAHQGALPRGAVDELERALAWKRAPHRIPDEAFVEVPRRLRSLLARLVGGHAEEVVLGNSASWGLQAVANGFPWQKGDEVLLVEGDYPPTIHPWILLPDRGVTIRMLRPAGPVLDRDELRGHLSSATRIVCTAWVNTYTGHVIDLAGLASACNEAGAHLIVNGTQGVGAIPIDLPASGVSGLSSSGFKWLCGPYGTGFAWLRSDLLAKLQPFQSYWLTLPEGTSLDLNVGAEPRVAQGIGARAFDVFGTANFFNFMPWAAAIEHLLSIGIDVIAEHGQHLIRRLRDELEASPYEWISPTEPHRRSLIVALSGHDPTQNATTVAHLADRGIDVALRGGRIRVSPHLYNSAGDVDALVAALRESAGRTNTVR
jgi:cysteine desulfurase/selenocysteine lyase